jgi:hypothetical protein
MAMEYCAKSTHKAQQKNHAKTRKRYPDTRENRRKGGVDVCVKMGVALCTYTVLGVSVAYLRDETATLSNDQRVVQPGNLLLLPRHIR